MGIVNNQVIIRAGYRVIGIECTPVSCRQKDNVLEWVMLLLPAKVDTLCQEEIRKLQVWSSIKNYNERKTRKENRKNRFRFPQNIRKANSFFLVCGLKFSPAHTANNHTLNSKKSVTSSHLHLQKIF